MDIAAPTPLLAGLTPAAFMKRHWQKRPLLVRQAWPGVTPPLPRAALFELAASPDVESRLIVRHTDGWTLRHGPLTRRQRPPLAQAGWTLLVQGIDLHVPAAHALLQRFAFVPAARLDDVMVSYATDGGGVGPHVDSYDVFLLQVHGRRRWRIGRLRDDRLVPGVPLKILQHFEPEEEHLLEPGDMLYLPPRWAHDGVAEGECMTASIGFRAPAADELARDLLQRFAEEEGAVVPMRYRDPRQPATGSPGQVPPALTAFARSAVERHLRDPDLLARVLGEAMSEPKPQVWFEPGAVAGRGEGLALHRKSRMLYDDRHVFINGEAFRAGGRDATVLRRLADERRIDASMLARLSPGARQLLDEWSVAGWLHAIGEA